MGVEKIQEDRLVGLSGGFLGLGQIIQPAYLHGHNNGSLPKKAALFWSASPDICLKLIIPTQKTRVEPRHKVT
jgi:hypothetical protein